VRARHVIFCGSDVAASQIDPLSGTVTEIAGNLPIGLAGAPGGLPTNIPTGVGVGASGTIYFSSDIENAIYKVTKK
jgi:hypothetical protein